MSLAEKTLCKGNLKNYLYHILHKILSGRFLSLELLHFPCSFLKFSLKSFFHCMTPSLNTGEAASQLSEEITIAGDHLFLHVTCYAYGFHGCWTDSTSRLTFPGADSPVVRSTPLHPTTGSCPNTLPADTLTSLSSASGSSISSCPFASPPSIACFPNSQSWKLILSVSFPSALSPCNLHWEQLFLPVCSSGTNRLKIN